MEIILNLLPPEKKKAIRNLYLILYLRIIIEILLIYSLLMALPLFASRYYLNNNFRDIQEKNASLNQEYSKINQEIGTAAHKLKNIDLIQNNFLAWTPYLIDIFQTTPTSTIFLKKLEFNKENKIIVIQGRAKTREALLNYKTALEKLSFMANLQIPVSSLTAKEDIDFLLSPTLILPNR